MTGEAGIRAVYATVDHARHPDALKVLKFWENRPADGIVMGRDVPSRAIADVLSHISILEPTEDRKDMRVRLVGASLIKRHGRDVKGCLLSELFSPQELHDHLKSAFAAIDADKPVIVDSNLMAATVAKLQIEVVVLPVFSPDRKSKWAMSCMFYFS